MKKYWYFVRQITLDGGMVKIDCLVTDQSNDDGSFPLITVRRKAREYFKAESVIVTFWNEISKETFEGFRWVQE